MRQCRVVTDLGSINPSAWQQLDTNNNPFLSYEFLFGLEKHDCLRHQYWQPSHILIEEEQELIGVIPMYIKQDSYGEFVFDWSWADAYHQAGRSYYPKLVSAIPFTPVCGHRLLINQNYNTESISEDLISASIDMMDENRLSSLHFLFSDVSDTQELLKHSGMERLTIQYHWPNHDYRDFKDFLDTLTSKKRKKIVAERRKVKESGIEIECLNGTQISDTQWEQFYEFYCSTFEKKWGEPRFTLNFFKYLGATLPEQTILILARKNNRYIAGAFAMRDNHVLYGRHWGCFEYVPFLHFELCYYQTIEYTINEGLKKLDAGVQGEHKLARGFEPVAMSSVHWIRETDFRNAINRYLERETLVLKEHISELKKHAPYKLKQDHDA